MAFAEKSYGRLDAHGSNAGSDAPEGNVWDLPVPEWQRTIDINLTGAFHFWQAAVRRMLPRGSGAIVSLSSHLSWRGRPNMSPAYSASEEGIIRLTAAFAVHLGNRGIRANAVAPGAIHPRDFRLVRRRERRPRESLHAGLGSAP
jgi:3-oxoacyl-[acyl-carrier protein] reductase